MNKQDLKNRFGWMTSNPTWQGDYALIMSMADSLGAKDALIVNLRAELAARTHDPQADVEIQQLKDKLQQAAKLNMELMQIRRENEAELEMLRNATDPLDDAEIEMLNEEVQDLRRKAAEVDANTPPEMSDVALIIRDKDFELRQLNDELRRVREAFNLREKEHAEKTATIEQLRKDLSQEVHEHTVATTTNATYAKEIEYLRAVMQRMTKELSQDVEVEAKFNEKISNYQKALDMTRQDEKVWRDRFDELMITFNSLKQSENNLATQLVQLRARHDDMKAAVRAAMED